MSKEPKPLNPGRLMTPHTQNTPPTVAKYATVLAPYCLKGKRGTLVQSQIKPGGPGQPDQAIVLRRHGFELCVATAIWKNNPKRTESRVKTAIFVHGSYFKDPNDAMVEYVRRCQQLGVDLLYPTHTTPCT